MGIASAVATVIATVGGVGLIGFLIYMAFDGSGDREEEEAARDFYSEHGYWPDEAPPAQP